MDYATANRIERAYFALPKDRRARHAFKQALRLAGHEFVECEVYNGHKLDLFRMYDDNGMDFPAEQIQEFRKCS